jgi:hypothetical protein
LFVRAIESKFASLGLSSGIIIYACRLHAIDPQEGAKPDMDNRLTSFFRQHLNSIDMNVIPTSSASKFESFDSCIESTSRESRRAKRQKTGWSRWHFRYNSIAFGLRIECLRENEWGSFASARERAIDRFGLVRKFSISLLPFSRLISPPRTLPKC